MSPRASFACMASQNPPGWWTDQIPLVKRAREEAARLRHGHIGAEHVFLALARIGAEGARFLEGLGLSPSEIAETVRRQVGQGLGASPTPPLTPRLAHILQRAMDGTTPGSAPSEHRVLEALVAEGESLPLRYLKSLGHDPRS